jgi:hypothetical protein
MAGAVITLPTALGIRSGGLSIVVLTLCVLTGPNTEAAIIVAAADSLPQEKARADLVCDGVDDQVELAKSLALGRRGETKIDVNPKKQRTVQCILNHAVEWLPGTYQLSATLEVPDAANSAIQAEGTTLQFKGEDGDAVIIRGMNRCRYRFGTIESNSKGAALCVRPNAEMPALMSFVNFTGLIGGNQRGTGLLLDPNGENICVNRFEGTDVLGFDRGVFVGGAGNREHSASTHGKCDTNWFWLSYVRMCATCIEESANGVDCSVWQVNVDASLPKSTAIRTAGKYGKWFIIMGTYTFEKQNLALVLEPGARNCVIEVHPPLSEFAWDDRSGVDSNIILGLNGELRNPPKRSAAVANPRFQVEK